MAAEIFLTFPFFPAKTIGFSLFFFFFLKKLPLAAVLLAVTKMEL